MSGASDKEEPVPPPNEPVDAGAHVGADAGTADEARPDSGRPSREERLEQERLKLLGALASGEARQQVEQVAWILNTHPTARDSDIQLQIAYWRRFQPELFEAFLRDPAAVYPKLARLTSLARSRAKIQNDYRLFQASREIRQRRKQLSEDERERHAAVAPPSPTITVYADESGKTGENLLVGSVWFIEPSDTWRLTTRIAAWRRETGFDTEFHFAELTESTLATYLSFIDLVFAEIPLISFKSIRAPRAGLRSVDGAFDWLLFELIRRGLAHEHNTGRAPMPRRLMLLKDQDAEGRGRDVIALSKLRESLTTASATHFNGQLVIEVCEALDSRDQPLLQLADLYTASLNRTLVRQQTSERAKDVVADHLLERIQALGGPELIEESEVDEVGDLHVHIVL